MDDGKRLHLGVDGSRWGVVRMSYCLPYFVNRFSVELVVDASVQRYSCHRRVGGRREYVPGHLAKPSVFGCVSSLFHV